VAENEESAEGYARERVIDDLEDEPFELFDNDWLMGCISEQSAQNIFIEMYNEFNQGYVDDIELETSDEYVNRLAAEMVERGIISEEEGKDKNFDFESKKDEFVEQMTTDQINEGDGGLEHYRFNFGEEEAARIVKENNLIDVNRAADDAISQDGWQHFISSYDEESSETVNGFVYWRIN